MRKNTKRSNQAFKVAYWADIQRVCWSATLSAFCHSWAIMIVGWLIPSALTVLQFLAALNRIGKHGYIGCACAYSLLAPQVKKATGRPCSPRTLERGLAFLRAIGLVDMHWWTIPDQIVRFGTHDVRVKGTSRVEIGGGQWRCLQIRIVTLTPLALALWDKATCKKGGVFMRHILHFPTAAKLAASSQVDLVGKPTKIKLESFDNVITQDSCGMMLDFEQGADQDNKSATPGNSAVEPTRPVLARAPGQTFEHRTVEKLHSNHQQQETQDIDKSRENGLRFQPENDTVDSNSAFSQPSGDLIPSPPPQPEMSKIAGGPLSTGVSKQAPQLPRTERSRSTWTAGRACVLNELHKALANYSRRQADSIYDRAIFETSRDYPAGWPTSVDWPYWIARFSKIPVTQRRYHINRDILPILKSKVAITPHEPHRSTSGILQNVSQIGGQLAPFLKKMLDRFGKD